MLLRLIDELPALVSYIDRETRYRFANRAYERWFGHERSAILGQTMRDVLGEAAWITLRPHVEAALAGQTVSYESEVDYQAGGRRWIAATYIPHREGEGGAGPVTGFTVLVSDVTERKRLERERDELLERERAARADAESQRNNLHRLFMEVPAAIAILRGPELRYELSNPLNQQLAGGRQLVGRTVDEALPELAHQGLVALVHRVMASGEPFVGKELPVELEAPAGQAPQTMYLTGTYQPLRGPTGRVEGVMAFAVDVTEQVRSRQRAEEAEERLRLAVEAAEVGTWDFDPRSGQLRCDGRYRSLFGLSAEAEVTAERLAAAIHPLDRGSVNESVQRAFDFRGGGHYAVQFRVRGIEDGIERWTEMRGRAYFDEQGHPTRFLGTGRDITEQRRAGERNRFLTDASAILGSSLDYRATLSQIAALAVPALADWCAVDLVKAGGAAPVGETAGDPPPTTELLALAHDDPEMVEPARELRRRYPLDHPDASFAQVVRDGRPALLPELQDAQLVTAARDPEHLQLLRRLGPRSALLLPLRVRDQVVAVVSLLHAHSGRRYRPEDLALGEELARRAGMAIENAWLYQSAEAAIQKRDDFVSIASHELRTPLSSLGLYLDTCLREVRRSERVLDLQRLRSRLERASEQVDRLTRLVNDLLDVSRISAGRLELDLAPVDLAALVTEVLGRLAEQAAGARCPVHLEAAAPVTGHWDRTRLDEVVTNLVVNAFKFGAGRPVTVRVEPGTEGGGRLTVIDQGPGVRLADRQRIFERFERTEEARNVGGIGLGLWIARQIVLAHRGAIRVEGEPGQGARFVVELPE